MKKIVVVVLNMMTLFVNASTFKQFTVTPDVQIEAVRGIIIRTTPTIAKKLTLEIIPQDNGMDVYEIESIGNKTVLRGNNGVSLASAYHRYLKDYCNAHISWNGSQLNVPSNLPTVKDKIRTTCLHKHRVYFNYCTLNYTCSWWDWERWEREIDFMAMNGINMPLGVVGLECVWYETLLKFGFTDLEARSFIVPPTHFAWQWMTNIQGDKDPIPKEWLDKRIVLGRKILERQRALGMTPIQQGFTGCVPRKLKEKFPDANIVQERGWLHYKGTAQLDPLDPLFKKFGSEFLKTEIELFGTSHFYAADPFHEGHPPRPGKEYLSKVGKAINELISTVDPKANIAMQSWSIRKEICEAFPKDRLIVLDLAGQKANFWGYNYVKGQLHNFGGRINMHGDLKYVAANPFAKAAKKDTLCSGMGLFPESIEQNPVFYNMVFDMIWRDAPVDTTEWLNNYAERRYGKKSTEAQEAWKLLLKGPYKEGTNGVELPSIIAARPAFVPKKSGPNRSFDIPYEPLDLVVVWNNLLADSDKLKDSEGYQFDVADLTRQVLSNLGQELQRDIRMAFINKDLKAYDRSIELFHGLLLDVDKVLSSTPTHHFGKWVSDAESHSDNEANKEYYRRNASMLLTIWGPAENPLIFDYSWREWSGLIEHYYLPRWERFHKFLREKVVNGESYRDPSRKTHGREALRANDFYSELADWEIAWNKTPRELAPLSTLDRVSFSKVLQKKYAPIIAKTYTPEHKAAVAEMDEKMKQEAAEKLGKKIWSWNPKKVSNEWKAITVDVTKHLNDAGTYNLTFLHNKGNSRLEIRKAVLLRNGVELANDSHKGFAGSKSKKNIYSLKLKEFAFNTKYEIKAEVRSVKGSNSYGKLRLRKK